ncbi:hypothetical protein P175DRAFT_0489872 [Aspergillus ochraceoroseus IBT 24754]|uniref:Spindle pole body-associated protein cut12 domain-containing protein n=2 Tax=Aspergillus ochraceoroseus TaxID=138278 RepID=A0A2T5M8B9_9EURO|nr:uncharacterized protein P175DRAFT_0489872 [Aspergillus ochraceoroseus IBT 24754]KKK12908.1 hypothetical protein AOCH_000467 [Aspergillus ochraceoroseus]PTU24779.1 hypothetical protein P175DRAFT_0489872 [Aspergillus ochraceoroseus IBT 24754]
MLGWVQNDPVADDSKILEPPETPAPVFALRAFQSALFGTPKADDEDNTTVQLKPKQKLENHEQNPSTSREAPAEPKGDVAQATKADIDLAVNAMASPTKSILMTPGTVSNRRKTVSFGESVIDNERKRDDPSSKIVRTPANPSTSASSQWISSSSDKPRSKLTQTLMDSREKPSRSSEQFLQKSSEARTSETPSRSQPLTENDDNEDTINMNEPRSQSGKYWKEEFDNYRMRTTLEIKRLIQYRSAAKTYARKKDEEASRLTAKLKEEELKVAEMERHVTQLASTMVAESTRADKEQLVQDLTRQTALALQYKHKVGLLRKILEQHGVVGSDVEDIAGPSDVSTSSKEASQALRKTQQALAQANARIEEMKQQQSEFDKLKDLALSSEQKASELKKENTMLKHTLARVKQEMSKYEGRRKEKEAKLRQREAKLEARIQECRDRLKSTSQQYREQEEELKESFNEERRQMQEQIDLLRLTVKAIESAPETRARMRQSDRHNGYTGVQVPDPRQISPQRRAYDETEETEEPPSPSPRAKDRRANGTRNDLVDLDLLKAMKEVGIDTSDEKFSNMLNISPVKTLAAQYRDETDVLPPSSPPPIPTVETGTWSGTNLRRSTDHRLAYLTSNGIVGSLPSRRLRLDDSHQIRPDRLRTRRSPTKYSLDALSALPDGYLLDRAKRRQPAATSQRDSLPLERQLAAQARLHRKDETRKGREGKENIRTSLKH